MNGLVFEDRAPAPDFPTFALALGCPLTRTAIGVFISDEDAALLARRPDWALTFYRQWRGEDVPSERGAPIALPRVVTPPPAPGALSRVRPVARPPASSRQPTRSARPRVRPIASATLAIGTVLAAGLIGAGIVQAGATAAPATVTTAPADPFPPGLVGPDAAPGSAATTTAPSVADRAERLATDVAAALRLDERTAAAPAVREVVRTQLVRIADLACLQGYDASLSSQVARAVSGRPDLGDAPGTAVADAIGRYCASDGSGG